MEKQDELRVRDHVEALRQYPRGSPAREMADLIEQLLVQSPRGERGPCTLENCIHVQELKEIADLIKPNRGDDVLTTLKARGTWPKRRSTILVKVPNNDEGFLLGEYQADYLPRAGDSMVVWHKSLGASKDDAFIGIVERVDHEVFDQRHPYAQSASEANAVRTTVWLSEEYAPPTLLLRLFGGGSGKVRRRGR